MTNKEDVYREIFNDARKYLSEFSIDEGMIDKHLNNWKDRKPKSTQELLHAMLDSVYERQGMPNAIGDIEKLRPCLEDFTPIRIIERYNNDWAKLFETIEKGDYKPPGRMVINNSKNYWVIFCKSVISASKFLSQFSNVNEFDNFVSQFYLNEYTRLALPLLLEQEIFGFGFALSCNFLKENGYPEFVKPDVHIKAIFYGTGISKSNSDYDIFKDVIRFSKDIGELPYTVDKLFWLVGSGNFYLDKVKIKTNRNYFIDRVKQKFKGQL